MFGRLGGVVIPLFKLESYLFCVEIQVLYFIFGLITFEQLSWKLSITSFILFLFVLASHAFLPARTQFIWFCVV